MTAFIASQFEGMEDLRLRIHQEFGRSAWLSEHSGTPTHLEDELIEEICLAQVRTSAKFICIIDGRYGTYSAYSDEDEAQVSLFELEIFQAFLSEKPIFLIYLGKQPSDKRLDSFIRVIQSSDIVVEIDCDTKKEIISKLRNIMYTPLSVYLFSYHLLKSRDISAYICNKTSSKKFLDKLSVEFLENNMHAHPEAKNIDTAKKYIAKSKKTERPPEKLALLWVAVRHLCATPYDTTEDPAILKVWRDALKKWGSAASWSGIHSVSVVSPLAAANTRMKINDRLQIAIEQGKTSKISIGQTRGGLASDHYSIAKKLWRPALRREVATRAVELINEELKTNELAKPGLLAIRGSLRRHFGDKRLAVRDRKECLACYVARDAGPGVLGNAMSGLGNAYWYAGKTAKARHYLETGLALLKEHAEKPKIISSMRKVIYFYIWTGDWIKAWRLFGEMCDLIDELSLRGRITGPTKFAFRLVKGRSL